MALNMDKKVRKEQTKQIGDLGEKIAVQYLKNKGFVVLETNYGDKWGELDIVAKNKGFVHFTEVKTLSYETREKLEHALSHETWRPEEQVHEFKLHQIEKTLKKWLSVRNYEGEWQIDVIAVRVAQEGKYATVNHIENIVI